MKSISLIVPCNNEAIAIPHVLPKIHEVILNVRESLGLGVELIVVNDASTDSSLELLNDFSWAKIIHLPNKSGYGEALKTGIQAAKGDWICFFDLDGTYDPEDFHALVKMASLHKPDCIFGERFSVGRGMPFLRTVGNKGFTKLVNWLFSSNLKDVCTGFRVIHSRHKEEITELSNPGLDYSLALTLWALKTKKRILEFPVQYHERAGESKLRILPDGNRFLWTIIRAHISNNSLIR